jgi:molybdopterin converting factor small subunit
MIRIDVKLNASLRKYDHTHSEHGLVPLELEEGSTVRQVIGELGIPPEEAKMVILNGKGATLDIQLSDGDRVALFPPEMAFNMYVAFSFRRDLGKRNID